MPLTLLSGMILTMPYMNRMSMTISVSNVYVKRLSNKRMSQKEFYICSQGLPEGEEAATFCVMNHVYYIMHIEASPSQTTYMLFSLIM